MAFYGKNYKLYKTENFDGFLRFVGVPDDKAQIISGYPSEQILVQNADSSYTNTSKNVEGSREVTFKSGVEFDDTIGPEKYPIKTKYVVDGNTVTQSIIADKGSVTFKREFIGDELLVTITALNWDGVAKRYYKVSN